MIPPRRRRMKFPRDPEVGDLVMLTHEVTPMVEHIRDLDWSADTGVGIVVGQSLSNHYDELGHAPTVPSCWNVWFPKENDTRAVCGDELVIMTQKKTLDE